MSTAFATLPGEMGFGGIIGFVLMDRLAGATGFDRAIVAAGGLIAGLAILHFTLGYTPAEWRAGAERVLRFGGAVPAVAGRIGAFLSRIGIVSGLLAGRSAGLRADRAAERRRTRIEPRLSEGGMAEDEEEFDDPFEAEPEEVAPPPSP